MADLRRLGKIGGRKQGNIARAELVYEVERLSSEGLVTASNQYFQFLAAYKAEFDKAVSGA